MPIVEVHAICILIREPEGSRPDRVNAVLPMLRGCFHVYLNNRHSCNGQSSIRYLHIEIQ